MDLSLLNKLLPPPLTNPFFRTPGQALDAVIAPIQQQTGIPGSYQFIEQGIGKLLRGKTPMERAQVGQPMVLGGRLGYKAADGTWQPRGDMESENIPQYLPGSPQADKKGYVWDTQKPQAASPAGQPPAVTPKLSPEEQAYNQERSRIAQLTAQNPEFQNIGQLRNDLRDQGMAIWAKANPTLAANVKPGQSGYDVIQGTLAGQAAAQGYGYQMPQQMIMTPPPGPNVPQGLPAVESIGAAETYGDKGLVVDPEMAKKFQALLNQSKG